MVYRHALVALVASVLSLTGCAGDGSGPAATPTRTLSPTRTPTEIPTATAVPPTSTPTQVPPSSTPVTPPSATATIVPTNSPTRTNTRVPTSTPTHTNTPQPSNTPEPTSTPTALPTATSTETPPPTFTSTPREPVPLRVGVAAIKITPCGLNPAWDGPITASGVWGEEFTDMNGNGRWDSGEPFVDDAVSNQLDTGRNGPRLRYNGIYMAGFGSDRLAKGCNDDIWARAVVIEAGVHKVAMVSVDLIGYVREGSYYGFKHAEDAVDPALGVDTFVFSSTHSHQGPDALGLWGSQEFADGKFPHYLKFVDQQVAQAITEAATPANMKPARAVAASTNPTLSPDLRGLQVRTGCRPPWFFDQELRALQFIGDDDQTIATVINWSTHPESLEDENELVSSDFIHYIREFVEADLGGRVVYFSGDLGAAEIVGDTCVTGADAHADDGTNEFDARGDLGIERTKRIGDLVGAVVTKALRDNGSPLDVKSLDVATARYHIGGANELFQFGNNVGILDLDPVAFDVSNCPPGAKICAPVTQHVLSLEDSEGAAVLQMVTAPGELFPELFYGVEDAHRQDCPAANTGEPYEPSIRNAMIAPFRWLIGLSPDQFGYIVPGYDFYAPPALGSESSDVCRGQGYDPEKPRRTVPEHYHESLSLGVDAAVATTCHALELLGKGDEARLNAACARLFAQ